MELHHITKGSPLANRIVGDEIRFWVDTNIISSATTVPGGFVHFAHRVILFAHDVILFAQRVILEQNFVSPTHIVKIEV